MAKITIRGPKYKIIKEIEYNRPGILDKMSNYSKKISYEEWQEQMKKLINDLYDVLNSSKNPR